MKRHAVEALHRRRCLGPPSSPACTRRRGEVKTAPVVAALLLLASPVAARRPDPCPDGRFLVHGVALVAGGTVPPVDAVVIENGRVAIASGCAARRARMRATTKLTTVRRAWRRCGALRRVRLRARIDAEGGCDTMRGTLRARGHGRQRFGARRSACGDGIVDAAGGEHCDGAFGCPPGLACTADCRCEEPSPVGATTTTALASTTTSTTSTSLAPSTTSTTTTTSTPPASTTTTMPPVCGNDVPEPGEECDDGNTEDGDGCSAQCALEEIFGGGGEEAGDLCMVQWSVAGLPAGTAPSCQDGAACDRGTAAGSCTFQVWYCTNVGLVTSGDPVPCRPTDIAFVGLAADTTVDALAQEAFLAAMEATLVQGGAMVTRADSTLTAAPPVTTRHGCGGFTADVPAGETRVVSVEATDSSAVVDRDEIAFTCTP